MSPEPVVLTKLNESGVALITLNRPAKSNAWTLEMETEYFATLRRCDSDPDVRAMVVTGAGRAFCVGGDMEALTSIRDDGIESVNAGGAEVSGDRLPGTFPLSVRKPMIAAINGSCAGGGLVQAMMCDVRFAAEGAKMTFAFSRLGLVAEYGISWLLPRIVGMATALDLLMSSRVFLAEDARHMGLVNEVLPGDQVLTRAMEYAEHLAVNSSPAALADIKSQLYRHATSTLDEAIADTDRLVLESFERADFVEGVSSFVEKRAPKFAPLGALGLS